MNYLTNSIFSSIQGEGFFTGMPSAFLRLAGCNLSCKDCDTNHQLTQELALGEVVMKLIRFNLRHYIITGGEPFLHNLNPLFNALTQASRPHATFQIETNGTIPDTSLPDTIWITCSPKDRTLLDNSVWFKRITELKFLITANSTHPFNLLLDDFAEVLPFFLGPIYIQPFWPKSLTQYNENLSYAIDYIKHNPRYRLSVQMHKYLNID